MMEGIALEASEYPGSRWPVLTTYDQDHLARVALPLGGIGTGTVSLGGRGDLRDWEIVNRPAKGFVPVANGCGPVFILWAKASGGKPVTRAIEGVMAPPYEGQSGVPTPNHGFPRFRRCEFRAAYPFGQVLLSDPAVPVDVRIEAFNPLVPGDEDRSGIPVAVLRYVLLNKGIEPVKATVCGSIPNFTGTDGTRGKPVNNENTYREGNEIKGIFMKSNGVDPGSEQYGTIALTTMTDADISYRTAWANVSWGDSLLDFWDDLTEDGRLDERPRGTVDSPVGSLATTVTVPAGGQQAVTFLLTWHFPNRQTWSPVERQGDACGDDPNRIGNYYATQYKDAWDVAEKTAAELPELEAQTLDFVSAFCSSALPGVVKEAALYNISTLRTQTCFRTEDGRFFGFEGCSDRQGCCLGSCTHVWNYEQTTAFLFGKLACRMREVEFAHATDGRGLMSFRVFLPLARAREFGKAAADGQMGCILKLYRDWQLSGDDELLTNLWPHARRALEFCWVDGGWDADRDGVMEGCQHNTLDVEYYGPNPVMGMWYLGALRAAEEMARYLGEADFAATCHGLFEQGSARLDKELFNGEYYEHHIIPPHKDQKIAEGLRLTSGPLPVDPPHQVGAGCQVDQLVGQMMAHVCGLGYLVNGDNVKTTLGSIIRYNFRDDLYDHFNHMRTFALNDEQGMVIGSYPKGRRPERPEPYFNELMTGFEYSAAVHMLYEGLTSMGLRCIKAIRARYDGRRRNPFNEAECGNHYARAMTAWGAVLALTGFRWSGVRKAMMFAAREGTHFWANGYSWGTCKQEFTDDGVKVTLTVLHGDLHLKKLVLTGAGDMEFDQERTLKSGSSTVLWVR